MISRFLSEDHRAIDGLFARLRRDLSEHHRSGGQDSSALAESFRVLNERLERHIRLEEQDLFPAAEAKEPDLAPGPGRVLRSEHEQLRSHMNEIRECFAAARLDASALQRIGGLLHSAESLLGEHNEKEEMVYYPLCDRLLAQSEAERMVRRLHEPE